jgi:hypothetical protein
MMTFSLMVLKPAAAAVASKARHGVEEPQWRFQVVDGGLGCNRDAGAGALCFVHGLVGDPQ